MKKIPSVAKLYVKYSKNNLQENTAFFDEMWYSRYVGRKVSIYFTWAFLKLGLGPNVATFSSLIVGLVGAFLLAIPGLGNLLAGSLLFQLYIILDSSDGELARIKKIKNKFGPYMDRLVHVFMYIFLYIALGVNLMLKTGSLSYLILGLVGALLMLVAIMINYIDPVVNSNTYKEYRGDESRLISYTRNIYNFVTGDVEIVIVLTILAPLTYSGITTIDFYYWILIINIILVSFGGILYSLYGKYKDERYQ